MWNLPALFLLYKKAQSCWKQHNCKRTTTRYCGTSRQTSLASVSSSSMFAVCTSPAVFTYLDLNWRFVFAISLVSHAGNGLSWQTLGRTWATYSPLHTLAQLNTSLPHVWSSSRAHCASSEGTDFSLVRRSLPFIQPQIPLLFQDITEHREYRCFWIWTEHQQVTGNLKKKKINNNHFRPIH